MDPALLPPDLLTSAAAALTDSGRTVPDRQVIGLGALPFDCEQLAVEILRLGPNIGERADPCAIVPDLALSVLLVRDCWPTQTDRSVPSAADITAASLDLLADAWALWEGLTGRWPAATLFPNADFDCEQVSWGDGLGAISPSGTYVAWRLPVTVALG